MTIRSEDTIIFNGLTPDITDMKSFYKAIEEFMVLKKATDQSDRFNIIMFHEYGPNYLNDFTLNSKNILMALKTLEPAMVKANIAGGIMVAITFIIDVYKKISEKAFRLIILTDSGSLKIPNNYVPVIEHLIAQVRDMPFFIDIIRLDVDDPEEDQKLMNLAQKCYGNVHEINDVRDLSSIMEVLALKREIPKESIFEEEKRLIITKENKTFYENLAATVKEHKEKESCSICFENFMAEFVECPSCGLIAHKSCLAQWAGNSNIGINNIFRCPNCYFLLKLEKEYVDRIEYEKVVGNIKIEEPNFQTYLESLESREGPEIVQGEDPLTPNSNLVEPDKPKEKEIKNIWCPRCNKMITSKYVICPNCGYNLKRDN